MALLRLCHRLRCSMLSVSGNKKALRLQCLNVPLLPNRSAAFAQKFAHSQTRAILRPASRLWLPLPSLNQRHREPCHASTCGSRLFLLVFSQKADRCAKPCSLLPPPAALLRLCHRLRHLTFSISGNKKALRLQCLNGSPCWT